MTLRVTGTYNGIAATATVRTDGPIRLADGVTVQEGVAFSFPFGGPDEVTPADAVSLVTTYVRTVDDVVTISESNTVGGKIIDDAADATDTIAVSYSMVVAETVTPAEAALRGIGLAKTETVTATETAANTPNIVVAETVTPSESIVIGTPDAWNPSDKSSNITLSNGNLTATETLAAVTGGVRALTSHSSGTYHFEVTFGGGPGSGYSIGIADSSQLISSAGSSVHGIVMLQQGNVYFNSTLLGAGDSYNTGSTVAVEVNLGTKDIWFQVLGQYRQGPFSFVGMGAAAFPWVTIQSLNGTATLNVGDTTFAVSSTSGYLPWG